VDTMRSEANRLGGRTTSPNAWRWFLGFEAILALIYFPFGVTPGKPLIFGVLPWMEWPGQVPAWALLGLSAVAAIVYGVRRNRPNSPIAWWFIGGGVLLFMRSISPCTRSWRSAFSFWPGSECREVTAPA